ncbi:helix-turn-helix transcriptional regulator [Sagittula stellata]|uniref:Imidazoleglycerol-phosphate dehydratase n=1 Tax=Sagittula stellata (strain ATCC 700073 / DSM 11524 / E-37) TaxID=388399 RepID=A3JZP1_SAGS3|nr:LuxR family transcriptional regulator [Sagittula stellata]EBA09944.1 imidazoleglycerol-phosphate dehydratase [Sagittula stellata E-37]
MEHFDGMAVAATETFVPARLLDFLLRLEATRTTDAVWELFLDLAHGLDLNVVEYVYSADFRNWEQAQFIRTTFTSDWLDRVRAYPHIRDTSDFRTHGCRYLTPLKIGAAYLPSMGEISADKRRHVLLAAEHGLNAGVAFPLRMGDPGHAALITFGGDHSAEAFDALLARHGWTLHTAALAGHARYAELFKTEFIERNQLTAKQKELLCLIGHGMMDKQIAHKLGVSFSAVRQRLASVQAKTGAQNRADLAGLAARIGLVPDPLLKAHGDDLTVFVCTGDGPTGTKAFPPRQCAPEAAE